MPSTYRPDIDGLRAVAVLGVIMFHAGSFGLPGGFSGVDVFFVISGFLITSIIVREVDVEQFSLIAFYERRARRILPALAAVLAVSTVAACLVLFPNDLKRYARSVLSIVVFASNFHFARESSYFDDGDDKPLLHTWSLGVEEQFYLFFPLLMLLLFRWSRYWTPIVITIIALFSFAIAIDHAHRIPDRAFFSSTGRAWELLLGALCTFAAARVSRNRLLCESLSVAGLAMILYGYLMLSDAVPYPGAEAIVPTLGAAFVILGGVHGQTTTCRLLAWPGLVGIGLISYSVYLWHWPLLVFAKYRFGIVDGHAQGFALLFASLALGYLSWRFIEQPFRRPKPKQPAIAFSAAAVFLTASACVAAGIIWSRGMPSRFSPEVLALLSTARPHADCRKLSATSGWPKEACVIGDERRIDTLVWGDSHARMLEPGFADSLGRTGRGAIVVAAGGCPPLIGVTLYGRGKDVFCGERARTVAAKIREGGFRRVVLVGRWALYAEGTRMPVEAKHPVWLSKTPGPHEEVFATLIQSTVRHLQSLVHEIVVIGPTPEHDWPVAKTMALRAAWGLPPLAARLHEAYDRRNKGVWRVLDTLDKEQGVRIVDPSIWLCDANRCPYASGGRPLYRDNNHLTSLGLKRLWPMFDGVMVDASSEHITRR